MMKLSKYIADNASPFFTPDFLATAYAPFTDADFLDQLYAWCDFNHGTLQIRPLIEDALNTDADIIRKRVTNLVKGRKYQYRRLYNTTLLEYKPIENYDMTEEGSDTTKYDGTKTINLGNQTNETTAKDSASIGSQKVTDSGESTTSNGKIVVNGTHEVTEAGSVTNEKKVAPFDSSTYSELEQNTESFKGRTTSTTDKTTTDAVTNKVIESNEHTVGAREDSRTNTVSESIGGRDDVHNDNSTNVVTHKLTRHGNIGVTTSQQMLQSEREVAMFNFIGIVAHDIIKSICICIY